MNLMCFALVVVICLEASWIFALHNRLFHGDDGELLVTKENEVEGIKFRLVMKKDIPDKSKVFVLKIVRVDELPDVGK